ncbi:PREDICTED: R3H and coiled-coil domain-containing protein 1 [Sturnus vulgaris]|uniref:R3H and coiled-coil domain-containing protein 1 n=1 Tax=Sturnus vulgaris TaxID=9172 RepID=UPI00071A5616|nr:PREDICTED: R3H and coiled-coil domain-containing protein 1 [Sturnus vulgaris]
MDGVFLSPSEDEFVGRISEELQHFMEQGQHQRVLLFPPLSSRLRYLIHRTVENMELLSSFSVGEGWRRRTVICHSAVRLPKETSSDQKPGANPARSQRPAQPWGRGGRGGPRLRHPGDIHGDNSRSSVGSGRIVRPPRKRPDKALFVSKGIRKKANWRERESPGEGDAAPRGENCPKNPAGHGQGEPGGRRQEAEEEEEDAAKGSAEHPVRGEKVPPVGNSEQENRDRDFSHPHEQLPAEAPGGAGTVTAQFQRRENQPGHNSRGSERGESSSPLEKHSWPQLAAAESPQLENQSLESDGNKSSPALQDPSGAAQSFPKLEKQEQGEQKTLGNVLEGPGEALAAPGGDPGAPEKIQHREEPQEEEEDKERWDVAEALGRSLGLAAGDTEGTGQSGLRDEGTAELLAEIVGNLTVKDISIERISVDYSSYGEAQLSEGDLGHITEIYDFPSSLKTEDLMEMFSDFHESGFKIQWVDETHALGIFSSLSTASQALARRYPCLRIRPLLHATPQAKLKALHRHSKAKFLKIP